MELTRSENRTLRRIQNLPSPSCRMISMMRFHVRHHTRLHRRQQRNRVELPEQDGAAVAGESEPAENVVVEEAEVEMGIPEAEGPLYDRILILGANGLSVDFPGELQYLAELLEPVIRYAMLYPTQ